MDYTLLLWMSVITLVTGCFAFGAVIFYIDREWDRRPRGQSIAVVLTFSAAGVWMLAKSLSSYLSMKGSAWVSHITRPASTFIAALIIGGLVVIIVLATRNEPPSDR